MENAASGVKNDVGNLVNSNENSSFVVKAMASNNEELILINAGLAKGTNSQLKSDARMMLSDHTKLKIQLQSYASKMATRRLQATRVKAAMTWIS